MVVIHRRPALSCVTVNPVAVWPRMRFGPWHGVVEIAVNGFLSESPWVCIPYPSALQYPPSNSSSVISKMISVADMLVCAQVTCSCLEKFSAEDIRREPRAELQKRSNARRVTRGHPIRALSIRPSHAEPSSLCTNRLHGPTPSLWHSRLPLRHSRPARLNWPV